MTAIFGKRRRPTLDPSLPGIPAERVSLRMPDISFRGMVELAQAVRAPIVTCTLILILSLIFLAETGLSVTTPSRDTLIAFGANGGELTRDAGEWWRLFTAPLLHGSLGHLIGNSIALFCVGLYLEAMIGSRWYGAVFAICALCGGLVSIAINAPQVVSVGASSGIAGLIFMRFLFFLQREDGERFSWMMRYWTRVLPGLVLPGLMGVTGDGINHAAHLGGSVAGVIAWLVVTTFWDDTDTPEFKPLAGWISAAATALAAVSFLLVSFNAGSYLPPRTALIPESQLGADTGVTLKYSGRLVMRYPQDPRSHLIRGWALTNAERLQEANMELRAALEILPIHRDALSPKLEGTIRMELARVMYLQGDRNGARNMARPFCAKLATVAAWQIPLCGT